MRLSVKLLVIFELALVIAVLVMVVPIWLFTRGQIIENMQNELQGIAAAAALQIDGDLHAQIHGPGDEGTPAFQTIRRQLAAVRSATGLHPDHIYTFYPDGEQVRFAVMLHQAPFVGEPYPLQPLMRPVLAEGTREATVLYEDAHGEWISAYAPIRDSAGAVVGLLEVDKRSETYLAAFWMATRRMAAIGLLALAVSSLVGWFVLQRVVIRPLAAVRQGIVALGRQDFTHVMQLRTGDEFQELAETFNGISQQLNVASMIQASFFPRTMPTSATYCLAGLSIPCDATGGDYFDVFELPGDCLAILVADVSGHGLGPSLLMATCRSAIRALSAAELPPGDLVVRLHELLLDDLTEGRFITLVYGVLGPDGTFVYANAGHGPAIIVENGTARHLGPHRPPLGIDIPLDEEERESRLHLEPGDRILFTSDGLSEAMNDRGEYFGLERIEAVVADRNLDCEGVVKRLKREMLEHCRGPSRTDDVTILCVDRLHRT